MSSDVPGQLCQYIVETGRRILVDTDETEIIWSDGAMLEIGRRFPPALQSLISRSGEYHHLRCFVKQLVDKAAASGWKVASVERSPQGNAYSIVRSRDGKISASFNSLYINYLRQRYPKAVIRITGTLEPIMYVVDGRIRAAVMPVKL
jgi:hypothetical protein